MRNRWPRAATPGKTEQNRRFGRLGRYPPAVAAPERRNCCRPGCIGCMAVSAVPSFAKEAGMPRHRIPLLVSLLLALALTRGEAAAQSPYAGQQARAIK